MLTALGTATRLGRPRFNLKRGYLSVVYDTYIAWRRLTGNGRRTLEDMSPAAQAESEALEITKALRPDPEDARGAYLDAG